VPGLERIGVYVWPWGTTRPTVDDVAEQARFAEEIGFDSVHLGFHTTLPTSWIYSSFGHRYILDQLVVLPVVVEHTSRIRVALNAAPLPSRHPFAWAQYLATLDTLSGGRTIAGAAPGWWADDFRIGGAPLEARGARMDEALDVVTRLWAGEEIESPGRFWDAVELALDPRPLQQPMPIWIGGGEPAVERAARLGSAWAPLFPGRASVPGLRAQLDEAAERHGRRVELAPITCALVSDRQERLAQLAELASFTGSSGPPEECMVFGSPEHCAERLRDLFERGADYVVLDFQLFGVESAAFAREQMSRFAESVAPLVGL
jgi:alkanesulfonate monooxygenase SsuD/methylene tetrahydromethanopterin reductase-like flavin-dependent oxidoreductase (luciferase family)